MKTNQINFKSIKHRLFIKQNLELNIKLVIDDPNIVNKINRVLRLKKMNNIRLFNGDGFEYLAQLQSISKTKLELELIQRIAVANATQKPKITLVVAMIKSGPMKWLLQKAVELGANEIIPLISERVVSFRRQDNQWHKQHRFEQIIISAAEQCGASQIPKLHPIISFNELMDLSQSYTNKIILNTQSNNTDFRPFIEKDAMILIGPEGDFSDEEYLQAKKNKFISLSLGKRILRAETATISILSTLNYLNLNH